MKKQQIQNLWPLALLFLIGIALRGYVFVNTEVINKDGILYINQAKAIYQGNWELAKSCGYQFISLYHLLIPPAYKVFGDWVVAAKSVSFVFGALAVVPFYLIARQLFNSPVALLTAIAFSITPFFVANSVELIKDPIFWFFALLGIFCFIVTLTLHSKHFLLALSSFFFLIASFARLEAVIYIAGSAIFILFSGKKRGERIFFLALPLICIAIVVFLYVLLKSSNLNLWEVYLEPRYRHFLQIFLSNEFGATLLQKTFEFLKLFVEKFIALIYVPFAILLAIGVWDSRANNGRRRYLSYFLLISGLSFLGVYGFYLKTEILSTRYIAGIVLPLFFFVGVGIEKIISFLSRKGKKEKNVIWAISLYILIFGIVPSLDAKRSDKLIYKHMGEYILALENNQKTIIAASDPRVMFYANLNSKEIECSTPINYAEIQSLEYPDMFARFKRENVRYFVWDERSWKEKYDFLTIAKPRHFKKINEWAHKKGRFVLFEVL